MEEVTDQELIEKAIDGMLSGLDPHSGFMNEEVFQEMQMDTEGKFGGLGIEITMDEGFVKVIAPIEDTPAYDAGVLAGDYIIQIDETPVFGLTLNEAVELMRGKKGEPIVITISRANTEPFEIEIIRDYIKIRSVKSEVLNNIGYLRITSFNEQTESGLLDAIKKIKPKIKRPINTKIIAHINKTRERSKIPHCQTKSELLINLNAAASSKKPITTLIEFNQPPLLGSLDKYWGNKANKKNGDAKAQEKLNIPTTGQKYAPWLAAANSAPTKATVHVKEVKVKVSDINRIPSIPPFPSWLALNCLRKDGVWIS